MFVCVMLRELEYMPVCVCLFVFVCVCVWVWVGVGVCQRCDSGIQGSMKPLYSLPCLLFRVNHELQ